MMDGAERELLARSVEKAMADHDGRGLDEALAALGWAEALAVDPHSAVAVLFETQGAANRSSSALDHLVASSFGHDPGAVGVVYPVLGADDPPGRLSGHELAVHGVAGAGLAGRQAALVVTNEPGGITGRVIPTASLDLRPVDGLDPWLGLVEVGASLRATTNADPIGRRWETAVADAQLAIGHELVGASRQMLELARTHALNRVQFGQPIGAFQAVRHRLADTLVAVETADAALGAAWVDDSPQAAAMAKALAGRSAATAARHCQQVLAGIGFTTEHPLHRFVRRVFVLDQLFGSSRTLTRRLGEQLVSSRRLSPLTPL
jgi:alkylation response protein AidB-like acyl-CoA dehydrogenase